MTHEINIYGNIVPFKENSRDAEYSLNDLSDSLSSLDIAEGDELLINIHSMGGDTATAFGIFHKLQNVRQRKNISITTRVDGWCASSGVIILLAGDKRIGNAYAEPFIHNAWKNAGAIDGNDAEKIVSELERVNSQIAKLYSERTNINYDLARQLMNNDDFVSPEKALEYGFYTELENAPEIDAKSVFNALMKRQNLNKNMSKDKSFWNKIKKDIDSFLGNSGTQNKVVFTADNSELDFYELGEDDTPAVGDKAKFDGKPAGDSNGGEYVMPSGETYKFTGEELTEIVPKEEDNSLEVENAALTTENESMKTEIENLKKEKSAINKKLADATSIINSFKKLNEEEEDEEGEKRDSKGGEGEAQKSRVGKAFQNLKNKNKDAGNK